MNPVETNEGVEGEYDDLIVWLKNNRLLKTKQKFIDNEITMDDLKAIDLKLDLNDFISKDLELSGIWATKSRKAITELQQKSGVTQPQQSQHQIIRTIVLSKAEDDAMTAINTKCNEATEYMKQLNNNINTLINAEKENDTKINEFEQEVINKVKSRMSELRQQLNKEINTKQQQISSYLNTIKSYHSTLVSAQKTQQKLLNDVNIDKLKRKTKIQDIYSNIQQNTTMNNKRNFNSLITVSFKEKKTYKFIKKIGVVQIHKYPEPPVFVVKNIKYLSATIELNALNLSLKFIVEIADDEEKADWQHIETLKNEKTYNCTNLDMNTSYKLRAKCKNEYGWSPYSEIIRFNTTKGIPYHPQKNTEKYHPRDPMIDVTKHESTETLNFHPGHVMLNGTFSCCRGDHERGAVGCKQKHACCSEVVQQKNYHRGTTNGCKPYYPCCNRDMDDSGCKKRYVCCGQDVDSKGCEYNSID